MPLELETDKWPFVPAKSSREVSGQRKVRLIVINSMEAPEKGDTAEEIAKYFQNPAIMVIPDALDDAVVINTQMCGCGNTFTF